MSSISGTFIEGTALTPAYWASNVRNPVLFSTALCQLAEVGVNCFIEVSPHPVLTGAVLESFGTIDRDAIVVPSLMRGRDDTEVLSASLNTLRRLHSPASPSGGVSRNVRSYEHTPSGTARVIGTTAIRGEKGWDSDHDDRPKGS